MQEERLKVGDREEGKEGERKKGRMEDEARDGAREGCREEKNLGMEVRQKGAREGGR